MNGDTCLKANLLYYLFFSIGLMLLVMNILSHVARNNIINLPDTSVKYYLVLSIVKVTSCSRDVR